MSEDEQIPGEARAAADSASDAAPATEAAAPEAAALEQQLAELRQQVSALETQLARERESATDYMHRWQRAQADLSNYKRRAQQEREQQDRLLLAQAVAPTLAALDNFERAFQTLPSSLRSYSWLAGISLVELQLRSALEQLGVRLIATEPGGIFDPLRHQAIGEVESAEHPAGHVAVVVQQGYELSGFVLRPALVQLARAPQAETAQPTNATAAEGATASETPPGPAP